MVLDPPPKYYAQLSHKPSCWCRMSVGSVAGRFRRFLWCDCQYKWAGTSWDDRQLNCCHFTRQTGEEEISPCLLPSLQGWRRRRECSLKVPRSGECLWDQRNETGTHSGSVAKKCVNIVSCYGLESVKRQKWGNCWDFVGALFQDIWVLSSITSISWTEERLKSYCRHQNDLQNRSRHAPLTASETEKFLSLSGNSWRYSMKNGHYTRGNKAWKK